MWWWQQAVGGADFLKPKRGTPCSSLSTDIYSFCSHLTGCWTSLSVSVYFGLICVCFVCCSCPEDRGHQEETAVVHRALQVTPQLPESLVCLRHTSVSRPHQPGQRSHSHICITLVYSHYIALLVHQSAKEAPCHMLSASLFDCSWTPSLCAITLITLYRS